MSIVLDAMGGDHAPHEIVKGALEALPLLNHEVILVGNQDIIERLLPTPLPKKLTICHASQAIEMDEKPMEAIRKKKQASIVIGAELVRRGEAEALVSAGNTGAVSAMSLLSWRQMNGIRRPAITSFLPNRYEGFLLLDAGASPDISPEETVQFGIMGMAYAKHVLNRQFPRVHLLNIGEEEGKGNSFAKQAYHLLSKYPWFAGNIEGKDMFNQHCDVVVCDAFVGNIVLKTCEGLAEAMIQMMRDELPKNKLLQLPYLPMKKLFAPLKKKTDYAEYGGSPLLGLNKLCVICHGRSHSKAIKNALLLAQTAIDHQLLRAIHSGIESGWME